MSDARVSPSRPATAFGRRVPPDEAWPAKQPHEPSPIGINVHKRESQIYILAQH